MLKEEVEEACDASNELTGKLDDIWLNIKNNFVIEPTLLHEAKEHIKQLLDCLKQDTNDPETNYYVCQYMDKAEQFLKGENIILEDAQAGNSPFDADEVFNKEMKAYTEEK